MNLIELDKEANKSSKQSTTPLSFCISLSFYFYWVDNHVDLSNSQSKSSEESHSLNSYSYLDSLQDTSRLTRSTFNFPPFLSSSTDITRSSLFSYDHKSDMNNLSSLHHSYTNNMSFSPNKDYELTCVGPYEVKLAVDIRSIERYLQQGSLHVSFVNRNTFTSLKYSSNDLLVFAWAVKMILVLILVTMSV